ncbi:RNA-directed DNA polymerase from mobile element jockey [Trichonephila clavipes]|nr:RNA-directed DNA polymerase from mobile element jockey [Trichonephila clavipes]
MYADDTAILSRHYDPNTLTQNINVHLAHLEIWFSVWKIAINTSKTEAISFSQKRPPPEITLQNQRIPWSLNTKYLGVIIDKNLTFRQHITYVRNKFKKMLRVISYLCLYYNGLMKVFKNGTELRERLQRAEQDRCDAAISKVDMVYGIPTKTNPFTTVKGKKGNRKTPSPPPERQTSKKLKTDEVDTANRYDALPVEDPPIAIEDDEENEDEDPTPHVPKFRKPPPITIDSEANSAALLKKLQQLTKEDFMGRVIGKGLRVYPNTPQAYHAIRNYIDREKLESYTYESNEEKELKAVIRGMPSDMPPQQIIEALQEVGIMINDCRVMTNRKMGLPMPLFLLSLTHPALERNKQGCIQYCRDLLHEDNSGAPQT